MPNALHQPEITKGDDQLTLVVYRDPGECSTFASRPLVREVVFFSNMSPPAHHAEGLSQSTIMLVLGVGFATTTVDTSRTSLSPLEPSASGFLHQEVRREGSPFGDHSNQVNVTDASTDENPSDSEDNTTDRGSDQSESANAGALGRWPSYTCKEVWAH